MARHLKLATASLSAIALAVLFSSTALASSDGNKYMTIYNETENTYTSVQHISGAHDTWVAAHKSSCAHGQSKEWWVSKYRKDVSAVTTAENKLSTVKNHRSRTYTDFVKTFNDLVHWMNGKIEPRLVNCRQMPKKSQRVAADLQTLQNDLGIINY